MPAMVGWVRWLVVGGGRGRWSVRGGVPTLERGNDQQNDQKDQHDQRGGTIDDQNGAHGAPYATNHSYLDDSIVVRLPAGV